MRPILEKLRASGITCVNYLDHFLLISETASEAMSNLQKTVTLLENLGFIINKKKSIFSPSTRCKYLGFIFDSRRLTLELPPDKRIRILKWIDKLIVANYTTIKVFARFLGIVVSACPAVKYGWVYTKRFERCKFLALQSSEGDYNAHLTITPDLKRNMMWWKQHINRCSNDLKNDSFQFEIFTDASLSGWGAFCQGEKTYGWWTESERQRIVNYNKF
nr:unnamed protein product [Callosobruchus analis]